MYEYVTAMLLSLLCNRGDAVFLAGSSSDVCRSGSKEVVFTNVTFQEQQVNISSISFLLV